MDTDNGWEKDIDARGGNLGCKSNLNIPKRDGILECSNVEGDSGTSEKGFLEFWKKKNGILEFRKSQNRKMEKRKNGKTKKWKNEKGDSGIPKIPKRKKGKNCTKRIRIGPWDPRDPRSWKGLEIFLFFEIPEKGFSFWKIGRFLSHFNT